ASGYGPEGRGFEFLRAYQKKEQSLDCSFFFFALFAPGAAEAAFGTNRLVRPSCRSFSPGIFPPEADKTAPLLPLLNTLE
ncbi:MAG: hypothetical protein RR035_09000, partial [Oscillibacter sp.]